MWSIESDSGRRQELYLAKAILLYSDDKGAASYATIHPIERSAAQKPYIGAGVAVTRRALLEAVGELSERTAARAAYLPTQVLACDSYSITWWCPPSVRRVFFECKELGTRSEEVPHPGLVFRASVKGFQVFALKGSQRPEPDTVIFEPPYFNTWDGGAICIGSARVPSSIDVKSIPSWESGFFDSAFTHPNFGSTRVKHKRGEYAFWKEMLDGKYGAKFPLRCLVPMNITLADVIAGRSRG
ncbi:PRTRC system protein B [Robbsia andropogonis]|uniref:PRTRC system protein B n=1 Tax=Robbsia andropogonis TaxID=28092 RepID=UPI00209F207E|nr:PRTRC system protein B [Robbsia andropogonis]MCP1121031.1 PRTRC system protein B [Robbsia andropogonis]MCP1130788.1 PRTRC system protein B [Robbsia andropogonis]